MENLSVGQLAKRASVNIETVRYYEKRKILPKPKRTESGYRQYSENDVARILFIKRAKELGFTLNEISELLSLKIKSSSTCGDVKRLAEIKVSDIEKKITDLNTIKKKLEELMALCDKENASTSECYILEALEVNL